MSGETLDDHERFKRLYKKFIDGTRWLNRRMADGTATEHDKEEFNQTVVEPMDRLWETFTDEQKDYWGTVQHAVDLFGGTIIIEDPMKKKPVFKNKIKPRKKRWRKYFR